MLGCMNEPTSNADLLKGDLSHHTPMIAQYQGVPFQAASNLGLMAQVVAPVPLESPDCLATLDGQFGRPN